MPTIKLRPPVPNPSRALGALALAEAQAVDEEITVCVAVENRPYHYADEAMVLLVFQLGSLTVARRLRLAPPEDEAYRIEVENAARAAAHELLRRLADAGKLAFEQPLAWSAPPVRGAEEAAPRAPSPTLDLAEMRRIISAVVHAQNPAIEVVVDQVSSSFDGPGLHAWLSLGPYKTEFSYEPGALPNYCLEQRAEDALCDLFDQAGRAYRPEGSKAKKETR